MKQKLTFNIINLCDSFGIVCQSSKSINSICWGSNNFAFWKVLCSNFYLKNVIYRTIIFFSQKFPWKKFINDGKYLPYTQLTQSFRLVTESGTVMDIAKVELSIDALRNGSEKDANFPLVALQHWADNIKFRAYCGRRDYMW